jgi:hypothetical protein
MMSIWRIKLGVMTEANGNLLHVTAGSLVMAVIRSEEGGLAETTTLSIIDWIVDSKPI